MDTLTRTHEQLLQAIGVAGSRLGSTPLTTLFPMRGNNATGELMIVGRAVNGSQNQWTPEDFADPRKRQEIVDQVVARGTKHKECPMQWLCNGKKPNYYNPNRSQFWSLTREVLTGLGIQNDSGCCWASHLIWSNLYKVAPSKGRNPSKKLMDVQKTMCQLHLREEIALWKPRRVLFLTGHDWCRSFLAAIGNSVEVCAAPTKHAQWGGTLTVEDHTASVVVAVHPERKRRNDILKEVLQFFALVNQNRAESLE